jgi:hypothetical protein
MAEDITTALTNVETAIATATKAAGGMLVRATPPMLAPMKVALDKAIAAVTARLSVIETTIDETAVGGVHVEQSARFMTEVFLRQSKAIRESGELRTMLGYLRRLQHNIITIPG